MVKAHQGEISLLRTENARAVQALREMLNGLKSQVNNIQSQNFTRGTEGGTMSQEVGDELVRLMARVGDLEATMEVVKTDFTANFCLVQNIQQGTNLMKEQMRVHQEGVQGMQRQILAVQDEVPRLRSRLQASEEAMGSSRMQIRRWG